MEATLTADQIVTALELALVPLDYTHAMWLGGASAFDRFDQWSDIDVQIVVDDDCTARAFEVVEQVLTSLSPIDLKFEVPQPTWHGHAQAFYRLEKASKYLLVDLAVMKLSSPEKFLQPEIHGQVQVLFDKSGVVAYPEFDLTKHHEYLRARVQNLRGLFGMFRDFPEKELKRGHLIEAIAYYHGLTLRPLVELLRIQYSPTRYNFQSRYVYYDLPVEVVNKLEKFYFIGNADELMRRQTEAAQWFEELLRDLSG